MTVISGADYFFGLRKRLERSGDGRTGRETAGRRRLGEPGRLSRPRVGRGLSAPV